MRLRRVHLGSLLVVALALAGATVVPARDVSQANAAIVWQARDIRRPSVSAMLGQRRVTPAAERVAHCLRRSSQVVSSTVPHPLFQRPPPAAASRT